MLSHHFQGQFVEQQQILKERFMKPVQFAGELDGAGLCRAGNLHQELSAEAVYVRVKYPLAQMLFVPGENLQG
jgi:hypothetical protein